MAKDDNWGWLVLLGVAAWWFLRPKKPEAEAAPPQPPPSVPEPIRPPSAAPPQEPTITPPPSADWAERGASYFGVLPGQTALNRRPGDRIAFEAGIRHAGPARNVDVAIIFAQSFSFWDYLRTGIRGHPDPDLLPVGQWRWATVHLPAAEAQAVVSRFRVEWTLPELEAGGYDVHRVIVDPPRWNGETYYEAYTRTGQAGPRDWDDDVFEIASYREWGSSQ